MGVGRCMRGYLVRLALTWEAKACLLLSATVVLLLCVLQRDQTHLQLLHVSDVPRELPQVSTEGAGVEASMRESTSEDSVTRRVLPGCPSTPPHLRGKLEVEENVSVSEAEARHGLGVRPGGFSWPLHCDARWSVAIIVPYRDRQYQVGTFLNHMHSFLQRQQLNYSIYLIEQEGTDLFNRARLLNVGFLESRKEGPWDCYAFHDVDMLPENDYHLYHCSAQPRHLAVATSNTKYRTYNFKYYTYYGGACLMTEAHVRKVNGWSNIYWGWGGEDDDMWRRIAFADMSVWRYPSHYARYKTLQHKPQPVNNNRYQILERNTGRYHTDGLNSINYTVKAFTRHPLYTHILADIGSSWNNSLTHLSTSEMHRESSQ
nr:beta-1,4-galactosyltransferase 4-like [Cherax quadricarinatus]